MAAAHKAAAPGGGQGSALFASRSCPLHSALSRPSCVCSLSLRRASIVLSVLPPPRRGGVVIACLAWVRGWPGACSGASLGACRCPVLVCRSWRVQSVRLRCAGVPADSLLGFRETGAEFVTLVEII